MVAFAVDVLECCVEVCVELVGVLKLVRLNVTFRKLLNNLFVGFFEYAAVSVALGEVSVIGRQSSL